MNQELQPAAAGLLRHYRLMATYNLWMNGKIFGVCLEISDTAGKQDLGAYFRSIHGTLNHILWADRAWLGRFGHRPPVTVPIGTGLFHDFAELAAERGHTDADLVCWAGSLQERALTETLVFHSSDGQLRRGPLWLFASHCFNHQTHHRGQVTTLMTQLGFDPGVTDIPAMPGAVGAGP